MTKLTMIEPGANYTITEILQ